MSSMKLLLSFAAALAILSYGVSADAGAAVARADNFESPEKVTRSAVPALDDVQKLLADSVEISARQHVKLQEQISTKAAELVSAAEAAEEDVVRLKEERTQVADKLPPLNDAAAKIQDNINSLTDEYLHPPVESESESDAPLVLLQTAFSARRSPNKFASLSRRLSRMQVRSANRKTLLKSLESLIDTLEAIKDAKVSQALPTLTREANAFLAVAASFTPAEVSLVETGSNVAGSDDFKEDQVVLKARQHLESSLSTLRKNPNLEREKSAPVLGDLIDDLHGLAGHLRSNDGRFRRDDVNLPRASPTTEPEELQTQQRVAAEQADLAKKDMAEAQRAWRHARAVEKELRRRERLAQLLKVERKKYEENRIEVAKVNARLEELDRDIHEAEAWAKKAKDVAEEMKSLIGSMDRPFEQLQNEYERVQSQTANLKDNIRKILDEDSSSVYPRSSSSSSVYPRSSSYSSSRDADVLEPSASISIDEPAMDRAEEEEDNKSGPTEAGGPIMEPTEESEADKIKPKQPEVAYLAANDDLAEFGDQHTPTAHH